jgi:hypothetical protein
MGGDLNRQKRRPAEKTNCDWIGLQTNLFRHLGGVPKFVVCDNLIGVNMSINSVKLGPGGIAAAHNELGQRTLVVSMRSFRAGN